MADHQRWALLFSMTEDVLTYHPQVPSTSAGTVMLPAAARLCFQRHPRPLFFRPLTAPDHRLRTMARPDGHKGNKQSLPRKPCTVCGRPMSWRKKWEKNWEQVKYCSEACRRAKGGA